MTDSRIRAATVGLLGFRIAYGAALIAAPTRLARRWLGSAAESIAGDLTDIAATAAGRDQLPDGSARATLVVAGTSALISAALAAAVDR
jgi:hypothetical protein